MSRSNSKSAPRVIKLTSTTVAVVQTHAHEQKQTHAEPTRRRRVRTPAARSRCQRGHRVAVVPLRQPARSGRRRRVWGQLRLEDPHQCGGLGQSAVAEQRPEGLLGRQHLLHDLRFAAADHHGDRDRGHDAAVAEVNSLVVVVAVVAVVIATVTVTVVVFIATKQDRVLLDVTCGRVCAAFVYCRLEGCHL